jgi:hypothetical protein
MPDRRPHTNPRTRMSTIATILSALTMLALSCRPAPPPIPDPAPPADVAEPPAQEAQNADAAVSALPPHLEALLDELEASGRDLTGFTADITYEKFDALLERREVRLGEILYRVDPVSGAKSFAILFSRIVINRRANDEPKHFIFDGRWLAEINQNDRQLIQREIVPPGEMFDPLKLGEGPIPLPIGQAKADVLKRFEVTDASLPTEGLLARLDAATVDGIRLIPLPGVPEADEFRHVDLFYDKTTRLPMGIDAVEPNDDRKTVLLSNVQRNPEFTDAMKAKIVIPEPNPREWRIDVQPWRGNG